MRSKIMREPLLNCIMSLTLLVYYIMVKISIGICDMHILFREGFIVFVYSDLIFICILYDYQILSYIVIKTVNLTNCEGAMVIGMQLYVVFKAVDS